MVEQHSGNIMIECRLIRRIDRERLAKWRMSPKCVEDIHLPPKYNRDIIYGEDMFQTTTEMA